MDYSVVVKRKCQFYHYRFRAFI